MDLSRRREPGLIILDLMLPRIDGLDVCRILRSESKVPIIMLTAKTTEEDKLVGLDLGADDYVTKPFSPRELVARVWAVRRRVHTEEDDEPFEEKTERLASELERQFEEADKPKHTIQENKNRGYFSHER